MTSTTSGITSALIRPDRLQALLAAGEPVVLLDVRFRPGGTGFREAYDRAHLAGAHYVDLTTQLQSASGSGRGARPLPDLAVLERDLRAWGIDSDSIVVVYSDRAPAAAARAWAVLRWAGVRGVRFLDGGLAAWTAAGGGVTADVTPPGDGSFRVSTPDAGSLVGIDEVAALAARGLAFDVRDEAAYAGEPTVDVSGSSRVATTNNGASGGHIPGARHLPLGDLVRDGAILPADAVRGRLDELGVRPGGEPIAVYCEGGVAASLGVLALREQGVDARLFVGSFSEWRSDPGRPIARSSSSPILP